MTLKNLGVGDRQKSHESGLNRLEEEGNGVRLPKSYIASQVCLMI